MHGRVRRTVHRQPHARAGQDAGLLGPTRRPHPTGEYVEPLPQHCGENAGVEEIGEVLHEKAARSHFADKAFTCPTVHPSTKIATLAEVLELINCYDTPGTTINLETKLDPLAPNETLPVDTYVTDIVPVLQEYGFEHRTVIQSFDWRTLIGIREAYPSIPLVALVDHTTVVPDETGAYPWLGGVSIDDFGGDWVAASASIGAKVLSPEHGYSAGNPVEKVSVNSKNYTAFVTKDIVDRAHQAGMQVIPWTVDEEVTISKLIDDGVDAIISNYPERVLWVGKQRGLSVGRARSPSKPECLAKA